MEIYGMMIALMKACMSTMHLSMNSAADGKSLSVDIKMGSLCRKKSNSFDWLRFGMAEPPIFASCRIEPRPGTATSKPTEVILATHHSVRMHCDIISMEGVGLELFINIKLRGCCIWILCHFIFHAPIHTQRAHLLVYAKKRRRRRK
jgi:hypothetical protein